MKTIFFRSLILILCLGCQQEQYISRAKFKTIMVKANGEVETLSNQASFSINLNCLKGNVKGAKKYSVEKSNELQQRLLALSIKKKPFDNGSTSRQAT